MDTYWRGAGRRLYDWLLQLDKLLTLRGLAALSVVIYHVQNYLRPNVEDGAVSIGGVDFSWLFLPDGTMPVVIFFTLSGYLMFKAFVFKRYDATLEGVARYAKSRAKRLLPLYYFIAFVLLILIAPKLFISPEGLATLRDVIVFDYNGSPDFVSPFWSLSVEVKFYVLVPIIFLLLRKYMNSTLRKLIFLVVVVGAASLLRYTVTQEPAHTSSWMLFATSIDAFLIGGAGAYVFRIIQGKEISEKLRRLLLLSSVIVGLGLLPLSALYGHELHQFGFDVIGVPVIALLTTACILAAEKASEHVPFVKRDYSIEEVIRNPSRIFELIGALSYGIYLWHGPIVGQTFVVPVVNESSISESLLRSLVAIIISAILAYLTYRYVELAGVRKDKRPRLPHE